MRGDNHEFLKSGSQIFLARGLDRPNQIEPAREIGFWARRFLVLGATRRRDVCKIGTGFSRSIAWAAGKANK